MANKIDEMKPQLANVVDALEKCPVRDTNLDTYQGSGGPPGGPRTSKRNTNASRKGTTQTPNKAGESDGMNQLRDLIKQLGESMVNGLNVLTESHSELKDTILSQNATISELREKVDLNSWGVISLKNHLDDQAEVMIGLQNQIKQYRRDNDKLWTE